VLSTLVRTNVARRDRGGGRRGGSVSLPSLRLVYLCSRGERRETHYTLYETGPTPDRQCGDDEIDVENLVDRTSDPTHRNNRRRPTASRQSLGVREARGLLLVLSSTVRVLRVDSFLLPYRSSYMAGGVSRCRESRGNF